MLVTASGRTRTFRCGTGSEYGSLFFALELVDWEHVHPEAIAQAESAKKPIEHSGRMIGIGGKRPVPADLVEHVGRIDGVDPESYVLGYGLSRRLNKRVSGEEVVRAIGEDNLIERAFMAHDLDIEEARRLFDRSSRDNAWRARQDSNLRPRA